PSPRASRDYGGLRDVYRGILAGGGKAGRFAPALEALPADPAAWRRALMGRRELAAEALERAIEPWSETALDRYRMPHPLLGKLTVREMLFFTLYHNLHHIQNVARRTGIAFAASAPGGGLPIAEIRRTRTSAGEWRKSGERGAPRRVARVLSRFKLSMDRPATPARVSVSFFN